jgi:ribosome-binding factor A
MEQVTRDYKLNAYADGFGNWHCEIIFASPMGNTNAAHATMVNAIRKAKALIRSEITERAATWNTPKPKLNLRYAVTANRLTNQNQLTYLRISEKI